MDYKKKLTLEGLQHYHEKNKELINSSISNHNSSTTSHTDIRNLISGLTTRLNTLADSDDTTLDQLSEIVAYIKSNRTLIENVTTNKVNVADIIDNLTSTATNKPLSANQGKVLNDLITTLKNTVNTKVDKVSGKGLSTNDLTDSLKGNYDTAYTHSQSTHARTDATKVEKSSTNGNIKINGTETTVYTHPSGTNPHGTTKSDVGLGNVGNFKAVSTVASQGLTDTEKSNARANIGAGTSSFSGSYNDLSNKPTIPTVGNGTVTIKQAGISKGTFTMNQGGNTTIELTDSNTTYGVATSSALGLVKSGTDITVDSSGNVSVNDDSHNHTQIKYCANISSDDAINNFLEAETFKTAVWTSTSSPGVSNGIILSGGYVNDTYGYQLAIDDDPTYYMALRQKSGNGWSSWKQIPMGDGTGASGTWNINISGNATTATSAGNADTLDGKNASDFANASHTHNYAGSSSAGGSANSAVSVVDYGNTSKTIKIGFDGAGATTSNLGYIAGYINNGTQIKDVNKDTLKSWLGLGSAAYTNSDAFATASHTHNYAGSSSAGGAATSAVKLDSSAGSATNPIYFSSGKPVACTYSLNKTVPSDAVFTDTNTWRGITTSLSSTSTDVSLAASAGKSLQDQITTINSSLDHTIKPSTGAGMHITYNLNNKKMYLILADENGQSGKTCHFGIINTVGDIFNIVNTPSSFISISNDGVATLKGPNTGGVYLIELR